MSCSSNSATTVLTTLANPRGRAARRAASPSIDTDKSLKDVERTADGTSALHARSNPGINKVQRKKKKQMKRGQRARQERGLEKAEIVMDRLEKKVTGSQSKLKKRKDRAALWDEINEASKEEKRKTPNWSVLNDDQEMNGEWENEVEGVDTGMKIVDNIELPASAAATKLIVVDRTASAVGSDVDEIT